ncbi:hypothetical protein EVAR_47296_1 [Eumeta japonica]|uniref:Uncharacterized protein n=1 Tax=Eumeta variegata TaxID=151549 RepID=A0A4C1YJM9_EUMVA|nr:hypothetical protein EVAR_47296_1 [Eumeta japonica]
MRASERHASLPLGHAFSRGKRACDLSESGWWLMSAVHGHLQLQKGRQCIVRLLGSRNLIHQTSHPIPSHPPSMGKWTDGEASRPPELPLTRLNGPAEATASQCRAIYVNSFLWLRSGRVGLSLKGPGGNMNFWPPPEAFDKGRKPEARCISGPAQAGPGWRTPPRLYGQSDTEERYSENISRMSNNPFIVHLVFNFESGILVVQMERSHRDFPDIDNVRLSTT